ncbi:MAG TPA: BON domain-containing protein [Anaeromyxobacter sp.]|nr:BON domain-containing protein [Anaeromyxobacter sp.]
MAWGRRFAWRRRGRFGLGGALAGLAAGAGLAYFLDPARGRERRARALDRTRRAAHDAERTAESRARDLGRRARGAAHEAKARVARERVDDEVLVERVRARLGRLVAHPRAIEVAAREGRVELSGAVFAAERDRLLRGVRRVRGVRHVDDRLRAHDSAEGVPELQGRGPLEPSRAGAGGWPAGAAAVAVAIGSAAAARALLGGRLHGVPAAVAGVALARGALRGSLARAGRDPLARRVASREAERARERERDREAHTGAWHPEPEVREVKSPAELEPGIAHASPEPTFPSRVARRGSGAQRGSGRRSRSGGGRRKRGDGSAGEAADPSAAESLPRAGLVAPPSGSGVRADDLGASPGADAAEPAEPEPGPDER